jgi:hypothetical protein
VGAGVVCIIVMTIMKSYRSCVRHLIHRHVGVIVTTYDQ